MKKVIALAAIAAFVACNGGQTKTADADSAKSSVDSSSKAMDTAKAAMDTAKAAMDTAKKTAADTTHKMKMKMKM